MDTPLSTDNTTEYQISELVGIQLVIRKSSNNWSCKITLHFDTKVKVKLIAPLLQNIQVETRVLTDQSLNIF